MAVSGNDGGYWLLGEDGSVYTFGSGPNGQSDPYGSPVGDPDFDGLATSITSTADGLGYWITDAAVDVFPFGDAVAYPSVG